MEFETLKYDVTDAVAVIRFARPDTMNAMTSQMRAEITAAVTMGGKEARALVITGTGRAFCSGQDLSDVGDAASIDFERTLRDEYLPMLKAITDCPIPTIAAVNGVAAGAGANLALSADVVIATQSAYFLQAFSRIGLIPDAGGTYWLPRSMGMPKAMGAALFAEPISAQQASDWGMIWEAVDDVAFEEHWMKRARTLAAGPTLAYGHIKASIRGTWDNTLDAQLADEGRRQGTCSMTHDFKEGVVAFFEKRPAKYQGR